MLKWSTKTYSDNQKKSIKGKQQINKLKIYINPTILTIK